MLVKSVVQNSRTDAFSHKLRQRSLFVVINNSSSSVQGFLILLRSHSTHRRFRGAETSKILCDAGFSTVLQRIGAAQMLHFMLRPNLINAARNSGLFIWLVIFSSV